MNSQLTNELLAFEADHVWISKNLKTLLEQYAEQWVAVKDGKVIASDPELAGLLSKLPNPAHTCVEFITSEPLEMVLSSLGAASLEMHRILPFIFDQRTFKDWSDSWLTRAHLAQHSWIVM